MLLEYDIFLLTVQTLQVENRREVYSWTEVDPSDVKFYDARKSLGFGASSMVKLARWKGSDVAVKIMHASDHHSFDTSRALRRELRVHERLRHKFITQLYGACTMNPNLWLVMEYACNGSLDKFLRGSRKSLDYSLKVAFLSDIANGMSFLHGEGILHRDLKSPNVLLFDNNRLKLCDFGLAKRKEGSLTTSGEIKGTFRWMAPELLNNEKATEKSDIYR